MHSYVFIVPVLVYAEQFAVRKVVDFALAADAAEEVVPHFESFLSFEIEDVDQILLRSRNNRLAVTWHRKTHCVFVEIVFELELAFAVEVE